MEITEKAQTGLSENSLGALSYLTVIPAIFFLAIAPYNRNSYVRFHAWQSTIFGAFAFLINFALGSLLPLTTALSASIAVSITLSIGVTYILIAIFCSIRALNGKRAKLPLIGNWAERQSNK